MLLPAIAEYPAGARLPPRVIEDFEFVWMLRGRASYSAGQQEISLTPGQLLLVPPGIRHGFAWDSARTSRHGYVHFGPEHLDGAAVAEACLRPMTATDPLAGLCGYLLWLGQADSADWQRQVEATVRFMLRLVLHGPLPDQLPDIGTPVIAAAVEWLRQEWSGMPLRRVAVTELAAIAHVSTGHLNRLFRTTFQLSVADAMQRLRCARAEPMLTRSDLTIQAVAHQCGFANVSHFSHRFTQLYGVPPSVYRTAGAQLPSLAEHPGVRHLAHLLWE